MYSLFIEVDYACKQTWWGMFREASERKCWMGESKQAQPD